MIDSSHTGWYFLSDIREWDANTGPNDLRASIAGLGGESDFLAWKPFCLALPKAQYERRDAARLLANLATVDVAAKPGVVACLNHQAFRTGAGATAARPAAATAGKGAQFYDDTLAKPIWSNGAAWTDAAGNPV